MGYAVPTIMDMGEFRAFIGEGSIKVSYTVSALTPHGAILEGGALLPIEADVQITILLPGFLEIQTAARVLHAGRDTSGKHRLMLELPDFNDAIDDNVRATLLGEPQPRPAA